MGTKFKHPTPKHALFLVYAWMPDLLGYPHWPKHHGIIYSDLDMCLRPGVCSQSADSVLSAGLLLTASQRELRTKLAPEGSYVCSGSHSTRLVRSVLGQRQHSTHFLLVLTWDLLLFS